MPGSPVTRTREIKRQTCILGFTGNQYVKSFVFDATSLVADGNGFFTVPIGSFMTRAVATDPTKVKVFQGLGSNVNAVQTLTGGTQTGGTFTLSFLGATTAPIAWNASAATVQAALLLLTSIGTGNVVCGGGALPSTPVTVTFQGALGNAPQPLLTASISGLTGGTPALVPTTTTPGQTAEAICGVYDGPQHDFFGNAVADDEAVPIYDQYTAFDTTLLQNWATFKAAAIAALPTCTFQP